MEKSVKLKNDFYLTVKDLKSGQPLQKPKSQPTNFIFVIDVSGSMYYDLQLIRKQLKNKLPNLTKVGDTITLIWFSGNGQAGILQEEVEVKGLTDLQVLNDNIDRYLQAICLTAFHKPLVLAKEALKQYLALKKSKENFETTTTLYDDSDFVEKEELDKIIKADDAEVLKPIYKDNQFYVIRKDKNIAPQVLPFKEVSSKINKDYIATTRLQKLNEKATELSKNFTSGIDLGYINRNMNLTMKGLDANQASTLQESIHNSTKPVNFVNVGDNKIVVYKITDTQFKPYDTANNELVRSTISSYKSGAVTSGLLEKLQNRYDVKTYLTE